MMNNAYSKQCDIFLNNCYSSYFVDKTPSCVKSTTNKSTISIQKEKNWLIVQADTKCADVVSFCIQNNIHLPGLVNKDVSILESLYLQMHSYFDMIHNHIVCIFDDKTCHTDESIAKVIVSKQNVKKIIFHYTPNNTFLLMKICVNNIVFTSWK